MIYSNHCCSHHWPYAIAIITIAITVAITITIATVAAITFHHPYSQASDAHHQKCILQERENRVAGLHHSICTTCGQLQIPTVEYRWQVAGDCKNSMLVQGCRVLKLEFTYQRRAATGSDCRIQVAGSMQLQGLEAGCGWMQWTQVVGCGHCSTVILGSYDVMGR